jgi:hypothetical protein
MKSQSDIFICTLKKDDYWAYPSPFVAHGGGSEIQFRNLTDDPIEIDLGDAPVHKNLLWLAPKGMDYVIVNGDAVAGLHEYHAQVRPKKAVAVKARVRAGKGRRPIRVKGGSPPRIIIDT